MYPPKERRFMPRVLPWLLTKAGFRSLLARTRSSSSQTADESLAAVAESSRPPVAPPSRSGVITGPALKRTGAARRCAVAILGLRAGIVEHFFDRQEAVAIAVHLDEFLNRSAARPP